jgi:hypothetical protein
VDAEGNLYVAGGTESAEFPVTPGVLQQVHNPGRPDSSHVSRYDAFVSKLSPTGSVIWSTFLGGPNYDRAYAIEIDRAGYVYVAGRAGRGFPVTSGAFQTAFQGGAEATFYGDQDGFLCKINPDGSSVVFCSYFGTSDPQIIRDIALDTDGAIFVAAGYSFGSYPREVRKTFVNRPRGGRDTVIAKIAPDGSRIRWAAYVGGSGDEAPAPSIRVDRFGNAVLLTSTRSSDAPTSADAYDRSPNGGTDFYITKWHGSGAGMIFGTYLGGSGEEWLETHNLELDSAGNVIIGAQSMSSDFPTTPGAYDRKHNGNGGPGTGLRTNYAGDGVIAKISGDGTALIASTFYGGRHGDAVEGVARDDHGNVHVTGGTYSDDLPITSDAFQSAYKGKGDAFVATFSADLGTLLFASYIGGTGREAGRTAAVDRRGAFYLAGETNSEDWPLRAARSTFAGSTDGMLAGFSSSHTTPTTHVVPARPVGQRCQ